MKLNKYPDGSSYYDFGPDGGIIGEEIVFRTNSYEELWHLNQMIDAHGGYPTVIIPNLIDAQADRRFADGQTSGLKLVCNFLNELPAYFKIFHPHNPEVVEALIDDVEIIDNSKFIEKIITSLDWKNEVVNFNEENVRKDLVSILMSSDAGGFKPLMKLCDKIEWRGQTYMAGKHRKYDGNETRLTQFIDRNDFQGKDILLIDDLSVYGGTFKGLSTLLRERNVGKLYLAVSHMTMQNLGDDPVTDYFDKVFTTNSKFDEYYCKGEGSRENPFSKPDNLEIINLF